MIKKYQRIFNSILVLLDASMLSAAYLLASRHFAGAHGRGLLGWGYLFDLVWIVPLILSSYFLLDIYSAMRSKKFRDEAALILRAHLVGLVALYGILLLAGLHTLYQDVLIGFAWSGLLLLLLERFIIRITLRSFRSKGYNLKHLLVIGAGSTGAGFVEKVLTHREFGYNIVAFLDDDPERHGKEIHGIPVIGEESMLGEFLEAKRVDEVIIALPVSAFAKFEGIVEACEREGVRARIIPDFNGFLTTNPKIDDLDGIPLLNIRSIPLDDPFKSFLKRGLDIIFSIIAVVITTPVMLVVAAGVKLSSPGPVLFKQERVGLNNRPFNMLKFRSMRVVDNETAATRWTTASDPRKTGFGAFIRKTSLDELPQFFNVLMGDMSIVGPRPERPFFVEQFKKKVPKYMVKHHVKPGITGWAQVNGWRGDTSIEKRINCDIYYIENWGLLLDFKIMFLTIFRGLVNRNAY